MTRPKWFDTLRSSGSPNSPERRDCDIVAALDALVERVRALEATTASCKQAEQYGNIAGPSWPMNDMPQAVTPPSPVPVEDTRPAWQRAKVGDRVSYKFRGGVANGVVEEICDGSSARVGIEYPIAALFIDNSRILSILSPEPERPKDETESETGIPVSELVQVVRVSAETSPGLTALIDEAYALGRTEQPQPVADDVREQARVIIETAVDRAATNEGGAGQAARDLASAGLLSGQPRVTVTREECEQILIDYGLYVPIEESDVDDLAAAISSVLAPKGILVEGE